MRERATVRHGKGRLAVVLVHAEHERALKVVAVEHPDELVVQAVHAVDVVPEVRVGVEEVRLLGELRLQLRDVSVDDFLGALDRRHVSDSTPDRVLRMAAHMRGAVIGSS